jgi:HEAT repeat protein
MRTHLLSAALVVIVSVPIACTKKDTGPDIPGLVHGLRDERERPHAQTELILAGEPAAVPVAELLRDPEPRIRLAAAQTLWSLGANAKDAVPQLTAALEDTSPEVRANVAMALELVGPEAGPAVTALTSRLRDVDWNVRQHAAKALGAIGPAAKGAIPALVRASNDDYTRSAATEALQKIQGPR